MANRTAPLVFATALLMVVASFSVRTENAYAHGSDEVAIDEIYAIKAEAGAALDAAVAGAADGFTTAATKDEAATIRDRAYGAIEDRFWEAASDMWWVAENAHRVDPVKEAFWDAEEALEDRANQAYNQVTAMYDSWVADHSLPSADEVIAKIEAKLRTGRNRIAGILDTYAAALDAADTESAARAAREAALTALADRVETTTTRLNNQLARLPDDPDVRDAYGAAIDELNRIAAAATSTINNSFSAWVANHPPPTTTTTTTTTPPPTTTTTTTPPPPTTTTTTTSPPPATTTTTPPPSPTTTTTVPPTTTTTIPPPTTTTVLPPTTSTTLGPAALLPPTEPPPSDLAYMTELPAPVVLSATAAAEQLMAEDSTMATIGLVRRVVDSQLPAGVSTVAAGPLVVLGLILDAIRAAGALMAMPWLLLGVYMAELLRPRRTLRVAGSAPNRRS